MSSFSTILWCSWRRKCRECWRIAQRIPHIIRGQGSVAFSIYFKVLLPNRAWVPPFLTLCVSNVKACSQASTKKSFCCHSALTKKSCEKKERSLPQTASGPFFRQPPKPHTLLPGLTKRIILGTCMITICVLGVFFVTRVFLFLGPVHNMWKYICIWKSLKH